MYKNYWYVQVNQGGKSPRIWHHYFTNERTKDALGFFRSLGKEATQPILVQAIFTESAQIEARKSVFGFMSSQAKAHKVVG